MAGKILKQLEHLTSPGTQLSLDIPDVEKVRELVAEGAFSVGYAALPQHDAGGIPDEVFTLIKGTVSVRYGTIGKGTYLYSENGSTAVITDEINASTWECRYVSDTLFSQGFAKLINDVTLPPTIGASHGADLNDTFIIVGHMQKGLIVCDMNGTIGIVTGYSTGSLNYSIETISTSTPPIPSATGLYNLEGERVNAYTENVHWTPKVMTPYFVDALTLPAYTVNLEIEDTALYALPLNTVVYNRDGFFAQVIGHTAPNKTLVQGRLTPSAGSGANIVFIGGGIGDSTRLVHAAGGFTQVTEASMTELLGEIAVGATAFDSNGTVGYLIGPVGTNEWTVETASYSNTNSLYLDDATLSVSIGGIITYNSVAYVDELRIGMLVYDGAGTLGTVADIQFNPTVARIRTLSTSGASVSSMGQYTLDDYPTAIGGYKQVNIADITMVHGILEVGTLITTQGVSTGVQGMYGSIGVITAIDTLSGKAAITNMTSTPNAGGRLLMGENAIPPSSIGYYDMDVSEGTLYGAPVLEPFMAVEYRSGHRAFLLGKVVDDEWTAYMYYVPVSNSIIAQTTETIIPIIGHVMNINASSILPFGNDVLAIGSQVTDAHGTIGYVSALPVDSSSDAEITVLTAGALIPTTVAILLNRDIGGGVNYTGSMVNTLIDGQLVVDRVGTVGYATNVDRNNETCAFVTINTSISPPVASVNDYFNSGISGTITLPNTVFPSGETPKLNQLVYDKQWRLGYITQTTSNNFTVITISNNSLYDANCLVRITDAAIALDAYGDTLHFDATGAWESNTLVDPNGPSPGMWVKDTYNNYGICTEYTIEDGVEWLRVLCLVNVPQPTTSSWPATTIWRLADITALNVDTTGVQPTTINTSNLTLANSAIPSASTGGPRLGALVIDRNGTLGYISQKVSGSQVRVVTMCVSDLSIVYTTSAALATNTGGIVTVTAAQLTGNTPRRGVLVRDGEGALGQIESWDYNNSQGIVRTIISVVGTVEGKYTLIGPDGAAYANMSFYNYVSSQATLTSVFDASQVSLHLSDQNHYITFDGNYIEYVAAENSVRIRGTGQYVNKQENGWRMLRYLTVYDSGDLLLDMSGNVMDSGATWPFWQENMIALNDAYNSSGYSLRLAYFE